MRGRLEHRIWAHGPTLDAPARYRRACAYDAFVPLPIHGFLPGLPGSVAGIVSEAESAIASLNADRGPELAPLARLLLRTESIASSKVEGLQVGTRELARAEMHEAIGRRIGPQAAEIIANIDAMVFAIEESAAAEVLSPSTIDSIHALLMRRAPNADIAGRVRDSQNWIGGNDYNPCGAAFVPPPPEEVPALLEDLVNAGADDTLPPLVHAAIVHAQFETIHPYADGNGRTGRALIHVILRRRQLATSFVPPISVAFARDKGAYIRGLTAFREGHVDEWIETFAVAARRAASLADRYLQRLRERQDRWRDRLREAGAPRRDAAAWDLIELLPAHPVISVPVAVAATGRTRPAVTNAIGQLVAAGVLIPLGATARNRAWEAEGLLDVIADLEAGEP